MKYQQVKCKRCTQWKDRIPDGRYGHNPSRIRYIDQQGKMWNGRVCGDCNCKRTKVNMYNLRLIRKETYND